MEGLQSFLIINLYIVSNCCLPGVVCCVYSSTGSTFNCLVFEVLVHNTDGLLGCSLCSKSPPLLHSATQ